LSVKEGWDKVIPDVMDEFVYLMFDLRDEKEG
jgi:hypothetical protein